MRPKTLRILGKVYEVKYTMASPVDDEAQGHCDYMKHRIAIREGLAPSEERSTVLHEALHCVSHAMGLHLPESHVERLENGLYALFADNPELAAYLSRKSNA